MLPQNPSILAAAVFYFSSQYPVWCSLRYPDQRTDTWHYQAEKYEYKQNKNKSGKTNTNKCKIGEVLLLISDYNYLLRTVKLLEIEMFSKSFYWNALNIWNYKKSCHHLSDIIMVHDHMYYREGRESRGRSSDTARICRGFYLSEP